MFVKLLRWFDLNQGSGLQSTALNRLDRGYSRPLRQASPLSDAMIRLIAVVFAVTLASSAQAMPRAALQQPTDIMVREAYGAGMHRVNGVCATTHARRAARRCAAGVTCR